MPYQVEFWEDAEQHLAGINKRNRVVILESVAEQLIHQPMLETRHRKLLRENPLASWELRVGEYWVFYNIDSESETVVIVAIGVKDHNALIIDGKEYP